jgi:predicted Rossmann-fold nucleotide-binding protein
VPYPTTPARLYTAEEIADGFDHGGFEAMYDTVVFRHFTAHGGPLPDVREALGQRLHDAGIDRALAHFLREHHSADVVGIMGGHAAARGSAAYRMAAALAHQLAGAGKLIATGGGPGVMEAANLGALLAEHPRSALDEAIDRLTTAADFRDHEPYTAAALDVRRRYGPTQRGGTEDEPPVRSVAGGLAIPTWLYGHEPANLFAGAIAKYFSNALREDTLLRAAGGGVVFAAGWAGTVQEVFQAATLAFYRVTGGGGPLVFLDRAYWTQTVPVLSLLGPLLKSSPHGDLSGRIHITDEVLEAVALLTGG